MAIAVYISIKTPLIKISCCRVRCYLQYLSDIRRDLSGFRLRNTYRLLNLFNVNRTHYRDIAEEKRCEVGYTGMKKAFDRQTTLLPLCSAKAITRTV